MPENRFTGRLVLALSLPVFFPLPTPAQQPAPAPVVDSVAVLVPVRAADAIEADLRFAEGTVRAARDHATLSNDRRKRVEARRRILETELDAIKQRVKLAKNEKRAADRQAAEARQLTAELALKALEEQEQLRRAEASTAEATGTRARAELEMLRLERDLLGRRQEQAGLAGPAGLGPEAVRLARASSDLERRILEAQREVARLRRAEAEQAADVADRRLRLFEAQQKLPRTP